jgi:ribosomal protein S18 acetylase RimI-like enzyme
MRALSDEVFAGLGDFDRLIGGWLFLDAVESYVMHVDGKPAGFLVLGYFEDSARHCFFADLLAIAVRPPLQGEGLGRAELRFAIERAKERARTLPIKELRLSVEDTNQRARALFISEGFAFLPYELGTYSHGQLALRMGRAL